ncbi:GRIP1-associated protein 1-like isoform X1 [Macrobrachium rosenbergii]|uniref:GRIP1-associated protein 1-like isoform X1 n=1 Tax=Macrobrachium rosenbergii TaxID=79674 RepID=UPI0034D5ABD5
MAQLDPDDFGKLQVIYDNQLLELREKNYSLEDALRKNKKGLVDAETRLRILEDENSRYQKVIQTSKKHSEVELMIRDNSYLRNKLRDQEEDFRLQNNTLLQELSRLVGENERYERQIKLLCGNQTIDDTPDGDHGCTDDSKEVLRLRLELTNMEKKLHESETRLQSETTTLKEKISALNVQVTQLRNVLKTHSIPIDEGEINIGCGDGVSFKKLALHDDDGLESDMERPNETLQQYQERTSQLQCEVERINNQLREEQEKISSLMTDKGKLEEDLRQANERGDIDEIQKLLEVAKNDLIQSESLLKEKTSYCENLLKELEEANQSRESASKKLQEVEAVLSEKEDRFKDLEEKVNALALEKTELISEKEATNKKVDEFQEELARFNEELESQQNTLNEQTKLAESRKLLMDEMKEHMEEERQSHKMELEKMFNKHKEELSQTASENHQLKDNLEEISGRTKDLEEKVEACSLEKSHLEEKISKLSEELEEEKKLTQEETNRVTAEKIQEMDEIKQKFDDEKTDLLTQLEISNIQRQELEESVEALKRKVADGEEEQRIHERKGLTLLKDLKKQLAVERKRADRLQEKLSQLLTDPAQLTAITTMSEAGDDVSSVSSWSMVSGEPRDSSTRENSIIVSPQGSPPPGLVTEETASLVNRVTDLQQQKWQLEERITHLESSSAAMAEDILKKSAIIQHYCMNRGSGSSTPTSPVPPALGEKLNVRRMLELIRGGGGEESVREINRRLQGLLEETLSKNIQLHQDVENLSQQVHQLSKLAAEKAES